MKPHFKQLLALSIIRGEANWNIINELIKNILLLSNRSNFISVLHFSFEEDFEILDNKLEIEYLNKLSKAKKGNLIYSFLKFNDIELNRNKVEEIISILEKDGYWGYYRNWESKEIAEDRKADCYRLFPLPLPSLAPSRQKLRQPAGSHNAPKK